MKVWLTIMVMSSATAAGGADIAIALAVTPGVDITAGTVAVAIVVAVGSTLEATASMDIPMVDIIRVVAFVLIVAVGSVLSRGRNA